MTNAKVQAPVVSVIVDCTTGRAVHSPLTPEEVETRQADADRHAETRQADIDARRRLVAAVDNSTDPAVRALAILLGVLPAQEAAP